MASSRLLVHIRPEANPENILNLLRLLSEQPDLAFGTVAELIDFGAQQGIGTVHEVESIASLGQVLGLLERNSEGVRLSSTGLTLPQIKDTAQTDVLHFLFYTHWSADKPGEAVKSWSYRHCLDTYWDAQSIKLTSEYLKQREQETFNEAEKSFRALGLQDFKVVSFSRKSLIGIHKWLDVLQPPAIENDVFSRRSFCPPELLLLAIGYVMGGQDDAVETDFLLSREKREAICRVCLLDPNAFDRALDWMLPIFPAVISPGTTAGFYGRFVRLHKFPTLMDIVR